MLFRIDIQELRAISILLVVFYHISSKFVPAGYIGVDIFFVISGYLVSNILYTYNNENKIKYILNFYGKRIKRLFPSSFICLLCYYHYHPTLSKYSFQETQLFYDILAAIFCISNVRFYRNTLSYFQSEKSSILINYWSLSLEEQFYFLLPFCYFAMNNSIVYIILFIISFLYCILTTYKNDSSSYYLLNSRAWELLLGVLASKLQLTTDINSQTVVYFIILSSYFIGTCSIFKFPGYIALIPTSFASLILIQKKNYIYHSTVLEIIGNMSYIIYLFHYPIIQNNKSLYIIFVKVYVITYLVYYYVEIPIKKSKSMAVVIVISILSSLYLIINIKKSIRNNKDYNIKVINNSNCRAMIKCSYSLFQNLNNYSILLIGDSHLDHYFPIILPILTRYKVGNILFLQAWITNISNNSISISKLILNMKNLLLSIISLYVDYTFLYVEKNRFEESFIHLVENILIVSKGIIIFQDNPHRIRRNDTFCKKYLLPIIDNKRIVYIDIFNEQCKGKEDCINTIYSKSVFSDFHHLKNTFVCNNRLIHYLIHSAIKRFLSYGNRSNITCNVLNLIFKNRYNIPFLIKYNIKPLKKRLKVDVFGFIEYPEF